LVGTTDLLVPVPSGNSGTPAASSTGLAVEQTYRATAMTAA
jgi:hypothetical protein